MAVGRFTLREALGWITILFAAAALVRFVVWPPLFSTGLKGAALCGIVIVATIAVTARRLDRGFAQSAVVFGLVNVALSIAILSSPVGHYTLHIPPQLEVAACGVTWAFLFGFLGWLIVGIKAPAAPKAPAQVAEPPESAASALRRVRWPAVVGMLLLALTQIPSILIFCVGFFVSGGEVVGKPWRELDKGIAARLAKHLHNHPQGFADLEQIPADDFAKYLANDEFRREVVIRLESPHERADLAVLLRLLKHPQPVVSNAARNGLRYAHKLHDAASLIQLTETGDRELTREAAYSLRFHAADPAVVPALERIAADAERAADVDLRNTARQSLQMIQAKNRPKAAPKSRATPTSSPTPSRSRP